MRLRSAILLVLVLFGLVPVTAVVVANLPPVLEQVELFYRQAYLQNLRADFRDLDQHLASRHEMVRLLARFPEPGLTLEADDERRAQLSSARARYTDWVNQILPDQLDIVQLLFLDRDGSPTFWLERDPQGGHWLPATHTPDMAPPEFARAGLALARGGVVVSPISLRPEPSNDPRFFMTMRLASPVIPPLDAERGDRASGLVVVSIDIGGMAQSYRNTLWVNSNGSYLRAGSATASAFADFPGLEAIFTDGKLALWEGEGRRVIWVPIFVTENSGPLWVGRSVDPSPLAAFRSALVARVLTIVAVVIVVVWVAARWLANRLDRFGRSLTDGIGQVIAVEEPVRFEWRGPRELRRLGRDLTRLADKHAAQVRELREHARRLEASNRFKSQFLANVSHELRTPLNSILLLSKMLADRGSGLTPDQAAQARVIHEAGDDLRNLIDDILDLSRIEAGRAPPEPRRIALQPMLEGLIELLRPQFDAKGISLTLDLASATPREIVTDERKLGQILKNFLANALKFTAEGSVRVGVGPSDADDRALRPLRIAVSDTGIGIPTDKQSVIFEAFQQADGSTSRRFGGTGLGLTISRELAQLIGGRIALRSEEGQGAEFALLLPLELGEALAAGAAPTVVAPPGRAGEAGPAAPPVAHIALRGRKVLVVDPDLRGLLALTPLLEGWGLAVTAAGDADEALEVLDEEPDFALVLVAAETPVDGDDGPFARIRRHPAGIATPLVQLAPVGAAPDPKATATLPRPPDPAALLALLERLLGET